MTDVEQILPADRLGRVRVSPERRSALLEEFDRSGMTAARFAAWAGIKYQTLASWLQKRRRLAKLIVPEATTFETLPGAKWVEAVVEENGSRGGGALVMHFPGEVRLEIADSRSAALAVEVLREWIKFSPLARPCSVSPVR